MFPVLDDGRLVGCVTTRDIKGVPKEQWSRETVAEMAERCPPEAIIPRRPTRSRPWPS